MYKYFKPNNSTDNISEWKSKGLSNESIKTPSTSTNFLNPLLDYVSTKISIKFGGSCSKQDKATYNYGKIVNIYIVYERSNDRNISSYPTLENCLFGAVKLTKHSDIDQYKCSGYGIGFDRRGKFSFENGFGRNVIILGEDMSSSVHANNKTRNSLVLGKDFIHRIDNTKIYFEKLHSINFTENNKKFC